jgi:hypothetical protein
MLRFLTDLWIFGSTQWLNWFHNSRAVVKIFTIPISTAFTAWNWSITTRHTFVWFQHVCEKLFYGLKRRGWCVFIRAFTVYLISNSSAFGPHFDLAIFNRYCCIDGPWARIATAPRCSCGGIKTPENRIQSRRKFIRAQGYTAIFMHHL